MSKITTVEELYENFAESNVVAPYYPSPKGPRHRMGPSSFGVPHQWKYQTIRGALYELARFFPIGEGRRNITLVNPSLQNLIPAICPTLCSGIQLVKPGEVALAHRHAANAFRLVMEAPLEGAYTVVNGCKLSMQPYDLILTPNDAWHDHRNEGDKDVIWLDALDLAFAEWIGSSLLEEEYSDSHSSDKQEIVSSSTEDLLTYGSGLLPTHGKGEIKNPLYFYPYERVRPALFKLSAQKDSGHETIMEYVNPTNGKSIFNTMSAKIRMITPGSKSRQIRRTENIVLVCLEGEGTIETDGGKKSFDVEPKDVVVITPWLQYRLLSRSKEPLVLFSFSDSPIFTEAGLFREEIFAE